MDSKYKTLGKNTFLVFLGSASSKVVGLVMLPLYTRWLSVSDYGTTDLITVYATLTIGIVSCMIYDAVFVFPKGTAAVNQCKYFTTALCFGLMSIFIASFIFYLVKCFSELWGWKGAFFEHIWLVYMLVASEVLFKIVQQFCRSIDKIVTFSASGLVVTASTAALSFCFIPILGVYGYVMSISLAYLFGTIYAFVGSGAYKYIAIEFLSYAHCKEMLKYSLPLVPNAIIWWIVDAINRPFLERYVGTEGIAFFSVANKFPGILTMVYLVFLTSWQISVLDEFGKPGYSVFYNRILRIVTVASSLILILITLSSKLLIGIFAAPDYTNAWSLIPILTMGAMFSNISGFVGSNFSATRESKYYFYSSIWAAASALFFNSILIPHMGVFGAALSTCLSLIVMAISRIIYSSKLVKIDDIAMYILLPIFDAIIYALLKFEVHSLVIYFILILVTIIHIYYLKDIKSVIAKFVIHYVR